MKVLAIDPGDVESGYALTNGDCIPIEVGKITNELLLSKILAGEFDDVDVIAVEMVASYGMPVGREVFETCVWIGRFQQALGDRVQLVVRARVKMHLCGKTSVKDTNIKQALIDRFAPGARNHGKGSKDAPTIFYQFKADIWQAFALAVLAADEANGRDGLYEGAA